MLKLKKIMVAMAVLGCSNAVFSGTMGDIGCKEGISVTVPCKNTGFEVGARALYLQPIYDYAGNYPIAILTGDTNNNGGPTTLRNQNYVADWNWGFMLEGAYYFGKGNDINVNWYHLNNATAVSSVYQDVYLNNGQNINQGQLTGSGSGTLHPEWDSVNAELGKFVILDERTNIRFYGGMQYAKVTTSFNSSYPSGSIGGGIVGGPGILNTSSYFSGVGPRGGIDLSYDLFWGFSVYGNGAGSLLTGAAKYNNTLYFPASNTSTDPILQNSVSGSNRIVAPEIEAKLGVKYQHLLGKGQRSITLDAGWMWVNYFNVQQFSIDGGREYFYSTPFRGGISRTDFAVQGLYFGMKLKM